VAGETGADSAIARRRASAREAASDSYSRRRAEIVATAAELFHQRGYQATSLADVAGAVGTDRASLYYYVGSKEELLDAVVSDVVRANLAAAEAIRDSTDPAPAKLRRLVVDIMDQYARHFPFLYVYVQENLAHVSGQRQAWAQEMRAINRRYEDTLTEIIAGGIAEGSLRAVGEPRVLAYGLLGMVSWSSRWFHPQRSGPDAATIGATYAEVLLGGLVREHG
jgi:AcrR family transcriptional regulator